MHRIIQFVIALSLVLNALARMLPYICDTYILIAWGMHVRAIRMASLLVTVCTGDVWH